MVFYRKYRPQKIDDLDNKSVRETLISILSNNPPHAFLFTGPKGLGKTSAARIIAKAVNCIGRTINNELRTKNNEPKENVLSSKPSVRSSKLDAEASIEPCNNCEQCKSITEGTNMDILEIDAASNRGIDEIRELKEKIRLSPMSAAKKVYIIDEVHMLTTEAFNALLKTLEEPPEHAMFILATTEPQKIPATILSRCLHISFTLATQEELVRSFKRIVKNEKIEIEDSALEMIAGLSEGGFRDGVKILEEVALLSKGQKITADLIEKKYSVISIKGQVLEIISAFYKKDLVAGLKTVANLVEQGIDMKHFLLQLIQELHKLLLIKIGVEPGGGSLNEADFSIDEIKDLFELLNKAQADTKYAVIEQLPLELAIIDWCNAQIDADHQEADSRGDGYQHISESKSASISGLRKQVGNIAKVQAMYGLLKQDSPKEKVEQVKDSPILLNIPANGKAPDEWIELLWKNIIIEMKNYNHTIAGVLRGCKISNFDKKVLIIETPFKFHKERLDDMKTRTELTKICKMLTGKNVEIEVQLRSN